jgi:hypothetical protein
MNKKPKPKKPGAPRRNQNASKWRGDKTVKLTLRVPPPVAEKIRELVEECRERWTVNRKPRNGPPSESIHRKTP